MRVKENVYNLPKQVADHLSEDYESGDLVCPRCGYVFLQAKKRWWDVGNGRKRLAYYLWIGKEMFSEKPMYPRSHTPQLADQLRRTIKRHLLNC